MRIFAYFLIVSSIISCSKGKSEKTENLVSHGTLISVVDSKTAQNLLLNYKPKPVWVVFDNFIPIDSIDSHAMIDYAGNLEHLDVFMCLQYHRNYAHVKFNKDMLVIGTDTMWMYHEQRIVGFYVTDFSYERRIDYLIFNDSGDYGESINLVSIDSTGKIIDAVCLMSRSGDGGDSYFSTLKLKAKLEYEITDFESHQNSNDSMTVIEEKSMLYIRENGQLIEKKTGSEKEYLIIGENKIMNFWNKIDY